MVIILNCLKICLLRHKSPILNMVVPSFVIEGAATSLHIHGKSLTNQSMCIFYMNDRDTISLKRNATIISPNLHAVLVSRNCR